MKVKMKYSRSKTYLTLLSLTVLSICLFTETDSVFAAQNYVEDTVTPIAPERNYDRETKTFPEKKKTPKVSDNNTALAKKSSAITSSIVPMIVMGAIVLGIFLWIALSVIKKILPGGKQLFSSPGIEILGRTHFDSQKYLSLVRVGTKVLVVGVSPNGFDQISEITDTEEVTEILSATKPKTSTGQNLFYKMFQKQIEKRTDTIVAEELSPASEEQIETKKKSSGKIADLQERIRKLKNFE